MSIEQQKPHEPLDGDQQANDPGHLDLSQYHGEILKLSHPSNRSKKNEYKKI